MKRFGLTVVFTALMLLSANSLTAQRTSPITQTNVGAMLAELPHERAADGGFIAGNPDAPITLIEFADYACPHCQNYRPIIDQILEDYVATGQAKFELRIFPTAGGQLTYYVGQLEECAEHQSLGAFWRSYDLLYSYANSGGYDENVASALANDLNLSYDKLTHCAESAQQVQNDIDFGNQWNVPGTPSIMVQYGDSDPQFIVLDDQIYNAGGVPYDVLAQVIEAANNLAGIRI